MSQMCSQCALGDCPDKMCVTHTIKICVDCKMAPYTNQITFANKLPGLKNEIVFIEKDNFNQKAPTIRVLKINNDLFKIKERSSLLIKLITVFFF